MNKVILKGNLARDPEMKTIKMNNGKESNVVNFTLAVSRFYQKSNGEKSKDTTFVLCEGWDSGAEAINKYFKKGDPMLLEGSLKTESWEKEGQRRSLMKVRVSSFEKLRFTDKEEQEELTIE
jgi:single-strand DNA-binding protein